MSVEQDRLSIAFEKFLAERRDHREGLSARQQLWTAFDAGARFILDQVTRSLPARNESERESGRRAGE